MILDVIIILILALSAFLGYKKGLVTMVISLAGIIVAIILAISLQNSVAKFLIEKTGLGDSIKTQISDTINQTMLNKEGQVQDESNIEKKDNFISNFIKEDIVAENVDTVAENITLFIFKGISFIAIFIVTIIIMYIIRMILNLVCELPILNSINKIGGLIGGIFKGSLIIFIILAIINLLEPMGFVTPIISFINSSIVTKFLYSYNLIVLMIKGNLKF